MLWTLEEPDARFSSAAFAALCLRATGMLAASLWAFESRDPLAFYPLRPLLCVALAVLLAPIPVARERNRACETESDVLGVLAQQPARPSEPLSLAIMPAAATLILAAAPAFDLRWKTKRTVPLVTMPASFPLFGACWLRLMRKKRSPA